MFVDIYANVRTLPPHIRAICMVQFFSWIGWFPVLFFSTVWVGEIYTLALVQAGVDTASTTAESTTTTEEATLVGFTALLYSSLLGLATIIALPLLVAFFQRRHKRHAHRLPGTRRRGFHIGLAEIWAFSLFLFGACMFATWFTQDSVDGSVAVIGLTGFCFAVSQWVPFSLLAEEILGGTANGSGGGADGGGGEYEALPAAEGVDEGEPESEEIPLHGGAVRLEEGHDDGQNGHNSGSRGVVFDSGDANEEGADERTLVDEQEHERDHIRGESGDQEGLMRDLEHSEFAAESPHDAVGHHGGGGQSGMGSSGSIGEKAGIILVGASF
jgi:solute carrier family 45 protein 1/2/4